jgi:hypothetical protein
MQSSKWSIIKLQALIDFLRNFIRFSGGHQSGSLPLFADLHRDGVIFKIDFEKAYDKVKWSFLQQTLRMKGFAPKWCRLIQSMVTSGSVGIKINDEIGHYFQTKRGLRQGNPLSPILFNIVANMLALLINRATPIVK